MSGPAEISVCWDLWYACNYRCSYCWWELENQWDDLAKQHRILPPEDWVRAWDRVADRCGPLRLEIVGGEPLTYPRVDELLGKLAARHSLQITTNLSLSAARLERLLDRLDPARTHFSVSFHPEFADMEEFRDKAMAILRRGFRVGVLVVTWPPILPKLDEMRTHFEKAPLPFTLNIFQGNFEGKRYPEAFTTAERAVLARHLGGEGPLDGRSIDKNDEVGYRLGERKTLGKPCHAGRLYAIVKGNGDAFRCGQDAGAAKPLGNLFDADFRLLDKPEPCPYAVCNCTEFRFLDEFTRRNKDKSGAPAA